jgi:hypothetical protein
MIILLLLWGSTAYAQGGIRGIFWNVEPISVGLEEDAFSYGLGYDRDLNDRLSMGLSLRFLTGAQGLVLTYRSAYHFSDNESSSFYMGPTLSVRSLVDNGMQVPVGIRIGVRGGLERFYADLYVGAHYVVGASGRSLSDTGGAPDLRQGSYCVGLDLGWGWAGKKEKW